MKDSIFVKKWIKFQNEKSLLTALVDFETKINFINQIYAMQWKLKSIIVDLSLLNFLNDQDRYCYNAFELIYNIINSWKQHKKCIILFYDVDFEESNVIFDMSMLTD